MREKKIIKLYTEDKMTLRMIADIMNSNHHNIKRVLVRNNIEITQKDRIRKPFTKEHRENISKATKGRCSPNKGKVLSKEINYKNMAGHIKFDVDYKFYMEFKDIERIKCLNKLITRGRVSESFDTEKYKEYIKKFYYDKQFNKVYDLWVATNKCRWAKPSLDHICPKSKGGKNDLDNLQILTWFENRAKCDMTEFEWEDFKKTTKTDSLYFVK